MYLYVYVYIYIRFACIHLGSLCDRKRVSERKRECVCTLGVSAGTSAAFLSAAFLSAAGAAGFVASGAAFAFEMPPQSQITYPFSYLECYTTKYYVQPKT
jgi:hypothetical protein